MEEEVSSEILYIVSLHDNKYNVGMLPVTIDNLQTVLNNKVVSYVQEWSSECVQRHENVMDASLHMLL